MFKMYRRMLDTVIIMYDASLIKNACVCIVFYASVLPSLHMHTTCI